MGKLNILLLLFSLTFAPLGFSLFGSPGNGAYNATVVSQAKSKVPDSAGIKTATKKEQDLYCDEIRDLFPGDNKKLKGCQEYDINKDKALAEFTPSTSGH